MNAQILDMLLITARADIIQAAKEFVIHSSAYDGYWYQAKKNLIEAVDKCNELEAEWEQLQRGDNGK